MESGGGALHHSSCSIPEMLPAVARAWKFAHMLRKGAVNFHEKELLIGQLLFLLWTRWQNFLITPRSYIEIITNIFLWNIELINM